MAERNAVVLVALPSPVAPTVARSKSRLGKFGGTMRFRIRGTPAHASVATLSFTGARQPSAHKAARQSAAQSLIRDGGIIGLTLAFYRSRLNWDFVQTAFDFVRTR